MHFHWAVSLQMLIRTESASDEVDHFPTQDHLPKISCRIGCNAPLASIRLFQLPATEDGNAFGAYQPISSHPFPCKELRKERRNCQDSWFTVTEGIALQRQQ